MDDRPGHDPGHDPGRDRRPGARTAAWLGLKHPFLDGGGQPAGFLSAGFQPQPSGILLHHYLSLAPRANDHRCLLAPVITIGDR